MAESNPQSVISSEESFLLSILHSLWRNRCVSVIVGLKIPDIICSSQDTSINIEEIATKSGCDSSKQLYPMMRLAAQWGIGIELENKHFAKNKTLELLRRDQGPSIGHMFEYMMGDEMFTSLRSLPACVKHGKPAFAIEHRMLHFQYLSDIKNYPYAKEKMYEGASKYMIGSDERRRELDDNYIEAMKMLTNLSNLNNVPDVNNLLKAFPWSECKKIVDIGGSTGDFLASILKLPGCENIQGYVLELPDVVKEGEKKIHDLGIDGHRLQFVSQDCLEPIPSDLHLDADTVITKTVICQFPGDKEKMTKFFSNCRALFPAGGGKLLIIEYCSPDTGDTDNNVGINGMEFGAYSIQLLNICGTNYFSIKEWYDLFAEIGIEKMGFNLHKIHKTFNGGVLIFELHYNSL